MTVKDIRDIRYSYCGPVMYRCSKCGLERTDGGKHCPTCHGKVTKKWNAMNREKNTRACKKWRDTHPEAYQQMQRRMSLRKLYGMTVGDYDEKLKAQQGRCAICGADEPNGPGKKNGHFMVDHDHKTGAIRGLLCSNCNVLLGQASDDVSILEKAIQYSKGYSHLR